jgi:hypothetical protein
MTAVVTVPVADNPSFGCGKKFRICSQRAFVDRLVQILQVSLHNLKYFDYGFSDKLNHKWRDPDISGQNDALQMLLANVATAMPGQQTVNELFLKGGQRIDVNTRGIVVYPARERYNLSTHQH